MGTCIKPIGGDFWCEGKLFNENKQNFENIKGTFLSGGQSALRYIFKNINLGKDKYVLMPSYLCHTMLYPLDEMGISYEFYKIDEGLSIDIKSIEEKIKIMEVKAVFFINYFGFYHDEKTREFLLALKEKGITLIEDSVQMLYFKKQKLFIGDYVFNSYRKFFAIDGSLVFGESSEYSEAEKDAYIDLIKEARLKKALYIKKDEGEEEEFLNLFHKAEEEYYKRKEILSINEASKELLNKVDEDFIRKRRSENYKYLYDQLKHIKEIKVLFHLNKLENNIPIGFPILIKNRDLLRSKMREQNIYCPVHWNILNEKWSEDFKDSRYVSSNILTLPIDQRYEKKHMERMVRVINENL